jgi:hypothetical protein
MGCPNLEIGIHHGEKKRCKQYASTMSRKLFMANKFANI